MAHHCGIKGLKTNCRTHSMQSIPEHGHQNNGKEHACSSLFKYIYHFAAMSAGM
jgi:hypothetical protein